MVDISVIIPCYNSEVSIRDRVLDFERVLSCTRWSWEIILCDDASQDHTADICRQLVEDSPSTRRFISTPINRGRGANVVAGFLESRGDIIGFADADISTSATYLIPIVNAIELGYDVAEAHRNYKIKLKELPLISHRILMHVGYRLLVSFLLNIQGHDTETGFKFFRRKAAHRLIKISISTGWFWDTEVIANAHKLNMQVAEIPSLFIRESRMGTTVHLFRDSVRQLKALIQYRHKNEKNFKRSCCR